MLALLERQRLRDPDSERAKLAKNLKRGRRITHSAHRANEQSVDARVPMVSAVLATPAKIETPRSSC
jgi:hypothetical protein